MPSTRVPALVFALTSSQLFAGFPWGSLRTVPRGSGWMQASSSSVLETVIILPTVSISLDRHLGAPWCVTGTGQCDWEREAGGSGKLPAQRSLGPAVSSMVIHVTPRGLASADPPFLSSSSNKNHTPCALWWGWAEVAVFSSAFPDLPIYFLSFFTNS